MKYYRLLLLCAAAFALLLAACGDDDNGGGTTTATGATAASATLAGATATPSGPFFDCNAQHPGKDVDSAGFPLTLTDGAGATVTLTSAPQKIASLDAAHTETLYAIGAADQVAAVDNTSDCPAQAAAIQARVDAFNPSLEAITALQPDLVITAFDTGDLVVSMRNAGLTVLFLPAPADINGTYDDIELVGRATGHAGDADALVTSMSNAVHAIEGAVDGKQAPTVYHEVDNTYYTAGPGSFIADLYKTLGAANIAESTGEAYPQLSAETIIAADPQVIVLADEDYGESPDTVKARPGWSAIDAVKKGHIYGIDPDIASRAGPRIVDALRTLEADLYPEAAG
jgi:iron complex transport system substrate-binding protein